MPFDRQFAGRGTGLNPGNRFKPVEIVPDPEMLADALAHEAALKTAQGAGLVVDADEVDAFPAPQTRFYDDNTKSIISYNDSPDIGMEASINPYRGCEHGCIYCYARPYHEYFGLSAGLDFETKIFVKRRAPELLRKELMRKSWTPKPLMFAGVTDIYQPAEKIFGVTRGCLEVLAEFRNPVGMITKNALILRDLDVLKRLAEFKCVSVLISITSLRPDLRRLMEPRTSTPEKKLAAMKALNDAGIPAGVMVGPIVPGLNEDEVPEILAAAGKAGAKFAVYTILRLAYGLGPMFEDWLARHFPERKDKVLSRVKSIHGGRYNSPNFHERHEGQGPFAEQIHFLFRISREAAGIPRHGRFGMTTEHFRRPGSQRAMF